MFAALPEIEDIGTVSQVGGSMQADALNSIAFYVMN